MIAAHSKAVRLHDSAESLHPSAGFSNVVRSIEGLQQRLEDFSLTEVTQAHKTAQTLTTRIGDLQRKLDYVVQIHQAVAACRRATAAVASAWPDADAIDAPEPEVRLNGFTQASNLIMFPRINKATDQNTPAVGPAALASDPAVGSSGFELVREMLGSSAANAGREQAVEPQQNEVAYFIPATELEREPVREEPQFLHEPALESATDAQPEQRPATDLRRSAADSRAEGPTTDFDQQLLDDLIQNYGEFVETLAPAGAAPQTEAPSAPARPDEAVIAEAPDKAVIAGAIEAAEKEPLATGKQTDIDRQLKNIMKDYGQNDIYSDRRRVSLKTCLIGAAVLTAMLVSGFYFLLPKQPNVPAASVEPSVQRITPDAEKAAGGSVNWLAPAKPYAGQTTK